MKQKHPVVHSLFLSCSLRVLSCSFLVLSLIIPCSFLVHSLFIPFSFLVHSLFVCCLSLFFPCSATWWKQHPNMSTYPYSIICICIYNIALYMYIQSLQGLMTLPRTSNNIFFDLNIKWLPRQKARTRQAFLEIRFNPQLQPSGTSGICVMSFSLFLSSTPASDSKAESE